jgi:hypothetical protein
LFSGHFPPVRSRIGNYLYKRIATFFVHMLYVSVQSIFTTRYVTLWPYVKRYICRKHAGESLCSNGVKKTWFLAFCATDWSVLVFTVDIILLQ